MQGLAQHSRVWGSWGLNKQLQVPSNEASQELEDTSKHCSTL